MPHRFLPDDLDLTVPQAEPSQAEGVKTPDDPGQVHRRSGESSPMTFGVFGVFGQR